MKTCAKKQVARRKKLTLMEKWTPKKKAKSWNDSHKMFRRKNTSRFDKTLFPVEEPLRTKCVLVTLYTVYNMDCPHKNMMVLEQTDVERVSG